MASLRRPFSFIFRALLMMILFHSVIEAKCPPKCMCVGKAVRCMSIPIDYIPKAAPDTTIFDLRSNRIKKIPNGIFSQLKQLETLMISHNQIVEIENDTFRGLRKLKYLYLYKNKIRTIEKNAFSKMDKLRQLYLQNNEIESFHPELFSNFPSLERLFLNGNKIKTIPPGSFQNLPSLRRLRLDGNYLDCNCNMLDFVELSQNVNNNNEAIQISAACSTPNKLFGTAVQALSAEVLQCEKPHIVHGPKEMEMNSEHPALFLCQSTGNPVPKVTWYKDFEVIPDDDSKFNIHTDGALMILHPTSDDAGTYQCYVENPLGEDLSEKVVMTFSSNSRSPRGGEGTVPLFLKTPSSVNIQEGAESLILECAASGNPTPYISWSKNSAKLVSNNRTKILPGGSLKLVNITIDDDGLYNCEARNINGVITNSTQVTVQTSLNLRITQSPKHIKIGEDVTLHCINRGKQFTVFKWLRFDNPLVENSRIMIDNNSLTIFSVKETDAGLYVCQANSKFQSLQESHVLSIKIPKLQPPTFVTKPFDIETIEGNTIEIPCETHGFPKPTVSWKRDGSNLVLTPRKHKISLKGSLYISNVSLVDNGRYECTSANSFGRVTESGFVSVVKNVDISSKPGDRFVKIAFAEAKKEVDNAIQNTIEKLFNSSGLSANPGDLYRFTRFPNAPTRELAKASEVYERTLVNIRKYVKEGKYVNASSEFDYEELLSPEHIQLVAKLSGCISHRTYPNCSNTCYHWKYRTMDGTCNNLANPTWGSSNTGFHRLLPPIYENGFNLPVGWNKNLKYNGFVLPRAREVSSTLITTRHSSLDKMISHMVMQFGQFLDHDLDHATPSVSSQSWDGIDCKKTCDYSAPCFPMDVPHADQRIKNRKCMDFTRSSAVCGSGMTSVLFGSVQHREQINQLTSFIDASQVYGFNEDVSQELRELNPNRGLLKAGPTFPGMKPMLPFSSGAHVMDCRKGPLEENVKCFMAGDIRANEQVGLLAMHTIWMREHNRIARQLRRVNPHWSGDTLFHEARKIVGAEAQHITYSHWLPLVIGDSGMNKLGQFQFYDPYVNPTIANVFATAALRFGHSLINPILHRLDRDFKEIPQGHLMLRHAFFSSWRLMAEGGVDPLMRGFLEYPAKIKTPTENLNAELTEQLFHAAHAVALDLAAMNIQRSRDHAIPFYVEWRKHCGMSDVKDFDDLRNEISSKEVRTKLKELYGSVKNIDVWVGGILEDQLPGAKVGPLFQCILVDQFRRLRNGDRFWYENVNVFKPIQVEEIKKSSLSRILCDNGDNIRSVTRNAFLIPSVQSGYVGCDLVDKVNLTIWRHCNDYQTGSCKTATLNLDDEVSEDGQDRLNKYIASQDSSTLDLLEGTSLFVAQLQDSVANLTNIIKSKTPLF